jgi:hypothetical protein
VKLFSHVVSQPKSAELLIAFFLKSGLSLTARSDFGVDAANNGRTSMNKIGRGVTLVLIMAALVVCVGSSQVQAIANGFPDTSNTFSNVGALIAVGPDGTG